MTNIQTIVLSGTEYVILTKAKYASLRRAAGIPDGSVDAIEFGRAALGRTLRAARRHAGLTQEQLAERLNKSQPMISGAESGRVSVSERYVAAVLRACELPPDWTGP